MDYDKMQEAIMNYKYCPHCKEDLIRNNYEYTCKNNHIIYINPAPCVSVIPVQNNKILLSIRGENPRKGAIDPIGGFANVGETLEECGIRETFEETGLKVTLDKFIGEYSEEYVEGVTYPLVFAYSAKIIGGEEKAGDDVAKLIWVDINDIEKLDFTNSFKTVKETLLRFKNLLGRGGQN